MVEISEIGLKEEEEVELDLGLSIGGSFRRSEKIIQPDPNLKDSHHHHHQQYQANVIMDPERVKREIHALRRMEAKKKREEKQQNKRHVMRESEPEFQNRASKREKTDLNLNATTASSTASFHHHPPYAYVQLNGDNSNNGYAYPCVVPWMVAPVPAVACEKEKNAGQPEKGFRPFSAGNGYGSSEKDCCGADNNNKKDKSDGSSSTTMCSSSVVSDYRSSSHEGGGSSESHSHSVHSVAAEPTNNNNNSKENNNMMITKRSHQGDQSQSASSHPIITSDNSNAAQSTKNPHIDQTKPSTTKYNNKKPSSPNNNEMKKLPPKPQLPPSTTSSFGLQKMPYVSTTGNGPNGKRVNGFLYRYSSKSEVSIVCVCHGSTFSPAEFVQHAGGTDISHPERHITVIPTPSFS